ncbi:MAG TPA: hydrogen peroxide-inducible genes activator [Xanthobacteraceae bacterium]|jgi:LysR family hydrogen peroxide-inducible transcriptional activator|nr:hydrogen peroxide-inducible genes activator [Xanthobacteraceae bacterium]
MTEITLRQLRYFDALAGHSHFGRAAAACGISQPALSMQIKELEEALGAVLIERGARQVRLTKFGEEAALRVRDILRSVDELADFARASRERLSGRLRIGMIPTIAPYLLPAVIENLARMRPELDIHVREAVTSKLIKELAEGRLDTAIVALPVSEPSLTEVALFAENFLLVRPGEDEGAPVPSTEKLRGMKLLLLEEGHCFRDQALSFCDMQSSPPREALDASSLSTLVQMVSAGMGVTLIPEMAVPVETRSASVSVAPFKDPQPSRTIGMIWRKTSPLAVQLLQLSEVIRRSCDAVRDRHNRGSPSRKPRTERGFGSSLKSGARRQKRSRMSAVRAGGAARSRERNRPRGAPER